MENKHKKVIGESLLSFLFFLVIGVLFWHTQGHIFFLFNFVYIGLAVSAGELLFGLLPKEKKVIGRKVSQLLVGLYMLGVLGLLGRENMQIEGFFFYLMGGVFSGPVIHYLIAKIGGTFLFGRGWCGWACWTAMVLDFLPWMKPANGRKKGWGMIRYIHFLGVLALVLIMWFLFDMQNFVTRHDVAFRWLIIGNLLYFAVGIILAAALKDNRAFCKYVCPIPAVMKIGARFSVMKIAIDREKCTDCGLCEKKCPMNIRLLDYAKNGQRVLSTECIACQQCVNLCPVNAVDYVRGFDIGMREYINTDR